MSNTVILRILHGGIEKARLEVDVDNMHKLIGIMSYGGWKDGGIKYVVEDYYLTNFNPMEVHVNVQTEEELNKKTMNHLAGLSNLSSEFKERLLPAFKRRGHEDLN